MCCSTRAVTDIVESNHLVAPYARSMSTYALQLPQAFTDWACKAKLFALAHTHREKWFWGFSQRAVSWCFAGPFCYRCVLKACPLQASLGSIMSNWRYSPKLRIPTVVHSCPFWSSAPATSAGFKFRPHQVISNLPSLVRMPRPWLPKTWVNSSIVCATRWSLTKSKASVQKCMRRTARSPRRRARSNYPRASSSTRCNW